MIFRFYGTLFAMGAFVALSFAAEADWDSISPEEFEQNASPIDPEAGAEVLIKHIEARQQVYPWTGVSTTFDYYYRFRVYNDRGVDQLLNWKLFYDDEERLTGLRARTVKSDGREVPLTKNMVYTEKILEVGSRWKHSKTFAFPDLEVGDIVELRYKKVESDSGYRLNLRFVEDIPVRKASWKVWIAGREEWKLRMMSFQYEGAGLDFDRTGALNYEMTNLPAFEAESYPPPWYDNQPVVILYPTLSGSIDPKLFWETRSTEIAERAKKWIKPSGATKKKAKKLMEGAESDWAKLRSLYDFCQKEILNLTYPRGRPVDKIKKNEFRNDAIKRGYGSMGDIVYLFASLANAAGFNAGIVSLPDKRTLTFDPEMTVYFAHLDEVVVIELEGEIRYFDPSRPYLPMGMVPWWACESRAVLAKQRGGGLVETPKYDSDDAVVYRSGELAVDEMGTLSGLVRVTYSGYSAMDMRIICIRLTKTERREFMEKEMEAVHERAEITDLKIQNLEDLDEPLVVEFELKVNEYSPVSGRRIFLKPALFQDGENPLFQEETRRSNIHFPYPWIEIDELSIDIPKGFTLEEGSSPGSMNLGSLGEYQLSFSLSKDTGRLSYNRFFRWEADWLQSSNYAMVKKVFSMLNTRDNHTLTFTREGASQ